MSFHLLRYYAGISLAGMVLIGVLLVLFNREVLHRELVTMGEHHNEAMARTFANTLWPRFAPLLTGPVPEGTEALRQRTRDLGLAKEASARFAGTGVLKVKVYSQSGMTVFSSEERQIGEDKSADAGFVAARSGHSASQLVHRNHFNAFEGEISDRDLISSYIPIRAPSPDGPVIGVFELYADVTPLLARMHESELVLVGGATAILTLLYLALLFGVRHAHRLIRHEEQRRERVERRLVQLAQYDPLTGLPNRLLFHDRLEQAVDRASLDGQNIALLFLDLDGFKTINDTLGHPVGDQLLKAVADRLSHALRKTDTLSRLGGDEFTVILEGGADAETAGAVAQKILDALQPPFDLDDAQFSISASIGIRLCPAGEESIDDLIKYADAAMYAAKEAGRNTWRFWSPVRTTAGSATKATVGQE